MQSHHREPLYTNKAAIIQQAMSSDISARTLEDADMVTLSYADVEGAATGNPLIKEKLDADAQVTKYTNASVQFQRGLQRAAAEAESLPKEIANVQDIISRIKDDVAHRVDTHGDKFSMIVEGKTYTKRTEVDKALESLKLTNTPRTIGNIGGFDVHAWQTISGDTKVELVRNRAYPAGKLSAASIENTLNRGIKDSLEYRRSALELEQDKLKQAQEKLKEKNPYTAKLKAARDKQRELEQKINTLMTEGNKPSTESMGAPVDTTPTSTKPATIASVQTSTESQTKEPKAQTTKPKGKWKTAAASPTREGLEKLINEYSPSGNWKITDQLPDGTYQLYNSSLKRANDTYVVRKHFGRWQFGKYEDASPVQETKAETSEKASKPTHYEADDVFRTSGLWNASAGKLMHNASLEIEADEFVHGALDSIANDHDGYYDAKQERFLFDDAASRDAFVKDATKLINKFSSHVHYSASEAKKRVTRTTEELKREIFRAFPGAKNIIDHGDRLTFTMPNGAKVEVRIHDNMTVTGKEAARARREHDIADGVTIHVNGSMYTLGRQVVIDLAKDGKAGTSYHEALHVAIELLFDDKAKTALHKKYGSEEKIADAYQRFMIAEQRGGHVSFAKLFRAIRDFFHGLASRITPIREKFGDAWAAQKAFEDLTSGKAWGYEEKNGNSRGFSLFNRAEAAGENEEDVDNQNERGDNEIKVTANYKDIPYQAVESARRRMEKPQVASRISGNWDVDTLANIIIAPMKDMVEQSLSRFRTEENPLRKQASLNFAAYCLGIADEMRRDFNAGGKTYGTVIGSRAVRRSATEGSALRESIRARNEQIANGAREGRVIGVTTAGAVDGYSKAATPIIEKLRKLDRGDGEHFSISRSDNQSGFSSADDIRYSISEEEQSMQEAEKSYLYKATDRLAKAMHLKSDKVVIDAREVDDDNYNFKDATVKSPYRVAEKIPKFRPFFNMAIRAMSEEIKNRNDFERKLRRALKPLNKKGREDLTQIMLSGDAEGKEYTDAELLADGTSEDVVKAYRTIRRLLNKAYHLANNARRNPVEKSARMNDAELQELRDNIKQNGF